MKFRNPCPTSKREGEHANLFGGDRFKGRVTGEGEGEGKAGDGEGEGVRASLEAGVCSLER